MTPEEALGHVIALLSERSDAALSPQATTTLLNLLNLGHTIAEERDEPEQFNIAVRELAEVLAESTAMSNAEDGTAGDEAPRGPAMVDVDTVDLVLLELCPLWPLC